ncbi:signal transduction histidine kinase, LytS [Ruminiclostridium papyrosolvens DSM 2782]|uniref:Signal transduction histidine kinase, LytS n=1 Tax=Ruminiclostridium papyrosolvens DSM 2782 TaxID=588581 RepID=F1TF82_9FIRM|nr:sensor histidine kinase [Ruminiclostridium papyrosolvens]EGD47020.1 signal transduction histidine kinase, LytS [Ruminiclostridium papyrosolvens DSM 2782]WES33731.1 histidine kinase [Ruminiclostridium papyrosolvens DSM 2782]
MKKRGFIRNLVLFALPLFIPIFILGTLSITITKKFIHEDINKSNMNLLKQTKENSELILNESDFLRLIFDNSSMVTNQILSNNKFTYEDLQLNNIVKELLTTSVGARPYIHSIYILFDSNKERFLASGDGVVNMKDYNDKVWYDSYNAKNKNIYDWSEVRNIRMYSFEKSPQKIVTLYMRLNSTEGVLVLNIFQSYFEKGFNSLILNPEQTLMVLNEDNQLIYCNKKAEEIEKYNLMDFKDTEGNKILNIGQEEYTINQTISGKYNWKYILITPSSFFYKVPIKITQMAALSLLISFLLGLALTFYITRKNYSQVKRILLILESAENGYPLPSFPDRIKDEYGYIIHNILKTFIEQSYLKTQLSERKYKLKMMELLALQSQINPHFLFNTLATISWETIIHLGESNYINRMIENLSDILRYSLESPSETVTLKKEIENTKSYIEIQKYRYGDKFDVIWECDPYTEDIEVTKLLMQPLVENSIYHGAKEKETKSKIKIKIKANSEYLDISVIDSGKGMTKVTLMEVRKKLETDVEQYEHIGLGNINKRLKLFYGNEYGLRIKSKYNFGSVVSIRIPISPS